MTVLIPVANHDCCVFRGSGSRCMSFFILSSFGGRVRDVLGDSKSNAAQTCQPLEGEYLYSSVSEAESSLRLCDWRWCCEVEALRKIRFWRRRIAGQSEGRLPLLVDCRLHDMI